jgi:transglutaminase-like putative cysteine protease
MDMEIFLQATPYVDHDAPIIREKATELFANAATDIEKARIAFEFVRDEIPHSFDIGASVITAKASDVLRHGTGICHAKANLLAALLRTEGVPTGFCFQYLTLDDDDSKGWCVHAYNAVFAGSRWIKLDARGNKAGVNAQFSLDEPALAFIPREQYGEYSWDGIYANPHRPSMDALEAAETLQDVIDGLPELVTDAPDIME